MLVHTYRSLKDMVSDEQADRWAGQFQQIDIRTAYNAGLRGMNWNIVSSCGELMQRAMGWSPQACVTTRWSTSGAGIGRCGGYHYQFGIRQGQPVA